MNEVYSNTREFRGDEARHNAGSYWNENNNQTDHAMGIGLERVGNIRSEPELSRVQPRPVVLREDLRKVCFRTFGGGGMWGVPPERRDTHREFKGGLDIMSYISTTRSRKERGGRKCAPACHETQSSQ